MPKKSTKPKARRQPADTYADLALVDIRNLIEQSLADEHAKKANDPFAFTFALSSYTLWIAQYNDGALTVACVAGEPTSADFATRTRVSEMRGILKQSPTTQYLVARREGRASGVAWSVVPAESIPKTK